MTEEHPPLPWPAKVERRIWKHDGVWCAICAGFASLNGYVWIPPEHPWSDLYYADIPVDVHGGLTYGPFHSPKVEFDGHVLPERGASREDCMGWVGFDTAHGFDLAAFGMGDEGYSMISHWTEDEVAAETEQLATQVAEEWRRFIAGYKTLSDYLDRKSHE